MKNNFTLVKSLLLILCIGFSINMSSQINVTYHASQLLVAEGQSNYDVDVRVSDFENILGAQFVITWNPDVLEIDSLPFISTDLPSLSSASFALPSQTVDMIKGRLMFAWTHPTATTLPDNHKLFTMRFNVIGEECSTSTFMIQDLGMIVTEVIRDDFVDIGLVNPSVGIEVAGEACTNFSKVLACNDEVNVSLNEQNIAVLTADMFLEGGPYNYAAMSVSPSVLTCSDVYNSPVQYTVTDTSNGNACWGHVIPYGPNCDLSTTLTCNSLINVSVGPWGGEVTLTPDMILEGGPYDYSVMTVTPATVDCSDIGAPINVTVTDTSNDNQCWATLNVEDKIAPVAIVKQNIVIALTPSDPGEGYTAKLYAESVDNGSHDNCTEVTFDPAFWEFDCSDIGDHVITHTVIDAYGNANSTWFDLKVELKIDENEELNCPDDVVVSCNADISDGSIVGEATLNDGCVIAYTDQAGYDANGDGDLNDEFVLNGETISESYAAACGNGALVRTWSADGLDGECVQIIGVIEADEDFDGNTMVDWPYSKNSVINLGDNDSGAGCSTGCSPIDIDDITLNYDANGNLTGANLTANCSSVLCEEPLFDVQGCDLVGFSTETNIFNLPNGDLQVNKTYTIVNWCAYNPNDAQPDGIWTYEVVATIVGGSEAVVFNMQDVEGSAGSQVCVPVSVSNFSRIESFQGTINWDADVLDYVGVQSFGLPGFSVSNFGTFDTTNGNLTYIWIDNTGTTPASLPDESVLFDVCFDVVGNVGDVSPVSFTDFPTPIEVSSDFQNVPFISDHGSVTVTENLCSNDVVKPTPYCINLSTALTANGVVELWAIDFNVGSFDNCTSGSDLRFTFNDTNPSNDPQFNNNLNSSYRNFSLSEADASGFVQVNVYVWDEAGNRDFCTVNLRLVDGSGSGSDLILKVGSTVGIANSTVCIPIEAQFFNSIETFQGSLVWDQNVATFNSVQNSNLPGFTEASVNSATPGQISFLWFDNSGSNPVTIHNDIVFEVCFDLTGSAGASTTVALGDNPVVLQASNSSGEVWRNIATAVGNLTIATDGCDIEESQIQWPLSNINVVVPNPDASTIFDQLLPDNLISNFGLAHDEVYPTFDVAPECQNAIAFTYEDDYFDLGESLFKALRYWTVLDWNSGNVFTFTQNIENVLPSSLICDFLPNSAPVGDCDSGHTLDDDVEWPDNVTINDHRITPSELVMISGVDPNDSKPVFFNTPDLYETSYEDLIGGLTLEKLTINREWTVTRSDIPGVSWTYIQVVCVDLDGFGRLVTVSTINNRPLSEVLLNDSEMTNMEGLAYIDGEADPERKDDLRNGLNIRDLMLLQSNVLGVLELNEFEEIAADFNGDNNISALDVFELERVLLGLSSETDVDWMFEDATNEIETGLEPKGHYVAVKPGDIDDSADIGLENPQYLTENLIIEDRLLNAGESYSVPLYIGSDINALGTELNLTFDSEMVEITGVNSDQVFGSISYNIINNDRIAMITENFDLEVENIRKDLPIVTIEIKALENGVLKNVFGVSDINESFILDSDYNLIRIAEVIEGEIILDNEELDVTLDINLFPNPVIDYLTIEDNDHLSGKNFFIELFDLTGKSVLRRNNALQLNVEHLVPGMYVYKISVEDRFVSGRILKQ